MLFSRTPLLSYLSGRDCRLSLQVNYPEKIFLISKNIFQSISNDRLGYGTILQKPKQAEVTERCIADVRFRQLSLTYEGLLVTEVRRPVEPGIRRSGSCRLHIIFRIWQEACGMMHREQSNTGETTYCGTPKPPTRCAASFWFGKNNEFTGWQDGIENNFSKYLKTTSSYGIYRL